MAKSEKAAANTPDSEANLTVEQLAYETGMSVRNIRNHQSRGLLPPPEVRARVGYYGPEHVARLRLIQEMQSEGFKLSAISRLIGEHGADADRFVGLRQAVTAPFATESPEVYSREELVEKFGADDDRLIEKAKKLGLLVELGEGRFEAPSPALIRAAEEVLAMGIELPAALAVIEKLERNAQSSARSPSTPSTRPSASPSRPKSKKPSVKCWNGGRRRSNAPEARVESRRPDLNRGPHHYE